MSKTRIVLATVATALVAGTAIFTSCNKENEVKADSKNDTTIIEEKAVAPGCITILQVELGRKYQKPSGKYECDNDVPGICVLFFDGAFIVSPMEYLPAEPCPYVSIEPSADNTLKTTMYFGKATKEQQDAIIQSISEGFFSVSEDVFIDYEDVLNYWDMEYPIVLIPGEYVIEDCDLDNSSFSLTIPYKTLDN